jgi:GT2 family glycosyltransferase
MSNPNMTATGGPLTLGICVLNWNSGATLTHCVQAIAESTSDYSAALVVVDNASTDDSVTRLRSAFPHVSIIFNSANCGFARGNNIGARHLLSKGCDLLLFVNPDVSVTTSGIDALIEAIQCRPRVGCCGGVPFSASGVSRMAARTRPSLYEKLVLYGPSCRLSLFGAAFRRHFIDTRSLPTITTVFAISGAMMLFRADAFLDIEGFDESTFLYEEELIVGHRLASANWETCVVPQCRYSHLDGHSTKRIAFRRRVYFIHSEQHLLKAYYFVDAPLLAAWRLFRYCECAPRFALTLFRSSLRFATARLFSP